MQFDQCVVHRSYRATCFGPNLKRDLASVPSNPLPEGDLSCLLLRYAQELAENLKVRSLVLGDPKVLILQEYPTVSIGILEGDLFFDLGTLGRPCYLVTLLLPSKPGKGKGVPTPVETVACLMAIGRQ